MAIGSGVLLPEVIEIPTFPILRAMAYTAGLGYFNEEFKLPNFARPKPLPQTPKYIKIGPWKRGKEIFGVHKGSRNTSYIS